MELRTARISIYRQFTCSLMRAMKQPSLRLCEYERHIFRWRCQANANSHHRRNRGRAAARSRNSPQGVCRPACYIRCAVGFGVLSAREGDRRLSRPDARGWREGRSLDLRDSGSGTASIRPCLWCWSRPRARLSPSFPLPHWVSLHSVAQLEQRPAAQMSCALRPG